MPTAPLFRAPDGPGEGEMPANARNVTRHEAPRLFLGRRVATGVEVLGDGAFVCFGLFHPPGPKAVVEKITVSKSVGGTIRQLNNGAQGQKSGLVSRTLTF